MSAPLAARRPTGPEAEAAPAFPEVAAPGMFDRLCRRLFFTRLRELRSGRLIWSEPGEPDRLFGEDSDDASGGTLRARVAVRSPAVYRRFVLGGTIGAADAYVDGAWESDDLATLVRLFARQRALHARIDATAVLSKVVELAVHALRPNSRAGSRRNVAAHYDLGNDFFAAFLDPTMTYSCGLFGRPDATMEEASLAKIDLAAKRLGLGPEDHLLEIGTGWGALAIRAAERYGCRVTTTTISAAQRALAAERIAARGLSHRIELLALDYRELPALRQRFDKVVSIEMIEAVGAAYLDGYLEAIDRLLRPAGRALVQAITVPDRHWPTYRRGADFIQRRVFPGSSLVAVGDLLARAARSTRLELEHLEDLTPHYATTLRRWHERLDENAPAIRAAGYPERLLRLWRFYFAYCEAGFLERTVGDVQLLFRKANGPELAA